MNEKVIAWISGITLFALAVVSAMLGANLLPPQAKAQAAGTFMPWLFAWCLIAVSVVSSIWVGVFLIRTFGRTTDS